MIWASAMHQEIRQSDDFNKLLNETPNDCSLEHVIILNQIVSFGRQLSFIIFKSNNCKIGLNTTANKLFPLNGFIGFDAINLGFVNFKRLMKFQFLKNRNT